MRRARLASVRTDFFNAVVSLFGASREGARTSTASASISW
jgi:hypothetical protein